MCFVHHWSGTITFIINYRVVDVFILLLFFSSLFFTIHVVLGEYFIIFYLGEYLINNFANEFDMIGIVIYIQPLPWLLPLLLIPSPFHTSHSYDLQKKKNGRKKQKQAKFYENTQISIFLIRIIRNYLAALCLKSPQSINPDWPCVMCTIF